MSALTAETARTADDVARRDARRFRAALDAMARPSTVLTLPDAPVPPAEADGAPRLSPAAFGLLALLADQDAPWRLIGQRRGPETLSALVFETGAAEAPTPERAAFLCGGWAALLDDAASRASIGTAEYPDRGATLIVEVEGVDPEGRDGQAATVSGPGLAHPRRLAVRGVDPRFWPFVAANRLRFPLGVDLYLTAGDQIVGLPRSLSVLR